MTGYSKLPLALGLIAGVLSFLPHAALSASACQGVDTKLTAQRKSDYAKLVAKSLNPDVKPSKVKIMGFMQSGTWSVAYADVPGAESGYFFFNSSSGNSVFKDVWSGMAEEGEGPEIAKWVRGLGANKKIASCFADTVTS